MSASEIAFFSLTPNDLSRLDQSNKTDKIVLNLRDNPESLLATILIGNNVVNVAIIIFSTYACSLLFDFSGEYELLGFLFESIIITAILLLFGEIMPKIYATHYAENLVKKGAPILKFTRSLLKPFSIILVNSLGIVNKKLNKYNHSNISVDDLSDALKITSNENDEDKEILEGIVKFGNTDVCQIMTSRLDMVDLDDKTSFENVLALIVETSYSRIPVYQGSKDNVRGILYIKDLLPHLDKNANFRWQSLVRPAYFIPETKKIDDLLSDFQKSRIHIAIVVDEFGGTSGLVTLEDILEEILGDINDEYDDDDLLFEQIDEKNYIFEAKMLMNDFCKVEGIDENAFKEISNEVETLAGLILELKGEIPKEGDIIDYKNYQFEVINADERRIEKVKLHIKTDDTENE